MKELEYGINRLKRFIAKFKWDNDAIITEMEKRLTTKKKAVVFYYSIQHFSTFTRQVKSYSLVNLCVLFQSYSYLVRIVQLFAIIVEMKVCNNRQF